MRAFILFCFFTSLSITAFAQVAIQPVIFSSIENDRIADAATAENGDMYVLMSLGRSEYPGPNWGDIITPDTTRSALYSDYMVMIFDKTGKLKGQRNVSNIGNYLNSIAIDKAGNIYITGREFSYSFVVAKLDPDFRLIWKVTEGSSSTFAGNKVLVDKAGNVYVAGDISGWFVFDLRLRERMCCGSSAFLAKFSPDGKLIWVKAGTGDSLDSHAKSIAFDKEGNIVLVGSMMYSGKFGEFSLSTGYGYERLLAIKYTRDGEEVWAKIYGEYKSYSEASDVVFDEFGDMYIAGTYAYSSTFGSHPLPNRADVRDALVVKMDTNGEVLWAKEAGLSKGFCMFTSIAYSLGKLHVTGYEDYGGSYYESKPVIASFNQDGTHNWTSSLGQGNSAKGSKILLSHDKVSHVFGSFKYEFNVSGHTFPTYGPEGNFYEDNFYVQVKDTIASPYVNSISGKVYQNNSADCNPSGSGRGIENTVVIATPGPFFGITDADGNYRIDVAPGTYTVSPVLEERVGFAIAPSCPGSGHVENVDVEALGGAISGINFGNRVTLSPYLSVSVSSTRRRRCFESTTTVRYSNSGFATAPDAKVYVKLPAEVGLTASDKAYTRLPDGTYVFAVGDLAAGQRGTITIEDIVTCGDESVRGRTVCTRAWMTPSNNKPAQPTPTITITGRCDAESGMIRFVIRNSGAADMEQHELFRKFANGELSSIEQFRLAAGDSMVLRVPSMGYTWRLEADQPNGNGDNTLASVTIEACTAANAGTIVSSGLVNLMPTDDEEAEVSEECMMITDSYDPNDKLVTPVGRTSENYTPTNTALKYKIRFQNTGTDVAYRVVVVDTLSEHLDLSTLQVWAASHASRFEVSGKGQPVLTWTFDNIMLPDSTTDEPGSHGYIQFSIKPKADLPEKTAVENYADIFFDFNSAIRTNVTVNRIYDMPPVVNEAVRMNLEDVLATPAIAAFEPAAGRFGAEVIITGKRFVANATDNKVYLNGKAATVVSATTSELRVLVPAGATTGTLKVITPDGGNNTSGAFEVYQPPVLNSFSPAEGLVGQTVTLQGQHLQPELFGVLRLGDLECEIIHHSGNSITVKVPAGATTGTFGISTKGGEAMSAAPFAVWYKPAISRLSKETDIVGVSITITGENFAADKARNKVLFGQVVAQVLEATPQQLMVRVPEQATSGFITVETPGGQAATHFEVIPGPGFTAMQPAQGSVGTVVEISGQHFGIKGLQDRIAFNGQEALVLEASGDRYKVRVPRGATTGKVQITGYGGKAYSNADFVVVELQPAEAIQVYPNPNSGYFTLNLQHADFDVQSVEIFDRIGKLIHTTTVDGPRPEKLELQIRSVKPGLYTLHVKSERGMIIKKITLL
ncbi:T9SS C-terminal target domain-containing protein [Pontibacter diazotrophicus]|uniref:T9SS C-terminal target domain-containing protein n=1 Tax=Pontibacter diazotrophicus TaxID=1400979 RepID=A0A3D8L2J3_9BACT|nr:IPT/TIG domain-containing protein [Pontibacter diazotrophicus]RDV11447.1 T9SS C-terminal target domain-containing protein [Pontibacter diazotrophicus]